MAVLDSFHMFGNHPEFTGTFNNILSSFLVKGRGYYLSLVVSKHVWQTGKRTELRGRVLILTRCQLGHLGLSVLTCNMGMLG